ncbi:Alpha/Beta hydrolase protein [Trichoderma barbatum]
MSALPFVTGPAAGHSHTHTIILLHGRDSEAQEFASEFFECEATGPEIDRTLPNLFPTVRWVFPQAKFLRSERFSTKMSQWFDMWSVEEQQERIELQIPGLQSSIHLLTELIKKEELLVPRKMIFLGGISQGFATVLAAFFADGAGGFAGLCGFCSWLPLANQIASEMEIFNGDTRQQLVAMQRLYLLDDKKRVTLSLQQVVSTPILLEHCDDDEIINVQSGWKMRDLLGQLGLSIEFHEYKDGGHWLNEPQGVDDFVEFIRKHINT